MIIAQVNQQTTVEQISARSIVVKRDGQVIQRFEGVANNELASKAVAWAKAN